MTSEPTHTAPDHANPASPSPELGPILAELGCPPKFRPVLVRSSTTKPHRFIQLWDGSIPYAMFMEKQHPDGTATKHWLAVSQQLEDDPACLDSDPFWPPPWDAVTGEWASSHVRPPKRERAETPATDFEVLRNAWTWSSDVFDTFVKASSKAFPDGGRLLQLPQGKYWLALAKVPPESQQTSSLLLGRSVIKDFYGRIRAERSGEGSYLLIGTPGIGKTTSLNYLLYLAITDPLQPWQYVGVVVYSEAWYCHLFDIPQRRYRKVKLPNDTIDDFIEAHSTSFLLLRDVPKGEKPPDLGEAQTIVSTMSPGRVDFMLRLKNAGATVRYLPPLSDGEMRILANDVFKVPAGRWNELRDCLKTRFPVLIDGGLLWATRPGCVPTSDQGDGVDWRVLAEVFGNVPRQVFLPALDPTEGNVDFQCGRLETKAREATASQLMNPLHDPQQGPGSIIDTVLLIYPKEGKEHSHTVTIRSGLVLALLAEQKDLQTWRATMSTAVSLLLTGGGEGFERAFHMLLVQCVKSNHSIKIFPPAEKAVEANNLTFLGGPGTEPKPLKGVWVTDVERCTWLALNATETKLPSGQYFLLERSNFPLVDGFVTKYNGTKNTLHICMYQCTIAAEHPPAENNLNEFFVECLEKKTALTVNDKLRYMQFVMQDGKVKVATFANKEKEAKNKIKDGTFSVQLSIVYLVNRSDFKRQELDSRCAEKRLGGRDDGPKYSELWSAVRQWRYNLMSATLVSP